jgi:hypothetical protein
VLVIGFAVGDIGKEQALPDGLGLFDPGLLDRDHAFGHAGVLVDDGEEGFGLLQGEQGDDGDHAHEADGQPAARHQIGDALALFDAVEHLGFEKTSQFRG